MFYAFQQVVNSELKPIGNVDPNLSQWSPPAKGWLMLNTDGAYYSGNGGYIFVLRDDEGRVLVSGAGLLEDAVSAEHAELLAIWHGFHHIEDYWRKPLILTTDCLCLVLQLQQSEPNLTLPFLVQ